MEKGQKDFSCQHSPEQYLDAAAGNSQVYDTEPQQEGAQHVTEGEPGYAKTVQDATGGGGKL